MGRFKPKVEHGLGHFGAVEVILDLEHELDVRCDFEVEPLGVLEGEGLGVGSE